MRQMFGWQETEEIADNVVEEKMRVSIANIPKGVDKSHHISRRKRFFFFFVTLVDIQYKESTYEKVKSYEVGEGKDGK